MKKIVENDETEGLEKLMGEKVILFCMNYNYAGTLIGVNETVVMISGKDASIVYETGSFTESSWKDAQKIGQDLYVKISAIECFFRGK